MLQLALMTPEERESYRPIWGEFAQFNSTFISSQRIFSFSGALDVAEPGPIALANLLVACSCERAAEELGQVIEPLLERLAGAGWQRVNGGAYRMETAAEAYQLNLLTPATREGRAAVHLGIGRAFFPPRAVSRCGGGLDDPAPRRAGPAPRPFPGRLHHGTAERGSLRAGGAGEARSAPSHDHRQQ